MIEMGVSQNKGPPNDYPKMIILTGSLLGHQIWVNTPTHELVHGRSNQPYVQPTNSYANGHLRQFQLLDQWERSGWVFGRGSGWWYDSSYLLPLGTLDSKTLGGEESMFLNDVVLCCV